MSRPLAARERCAVPDCPPPAGDGVLVIDKPHGPTSHDVVGAVRRWLRRADVGHAGTLDPFATGVLLVLVGEATKLSAHLTVEEKRYQARIRLGASTDTLDAEGQVTETAAVAPEQPAPSRLAAALDTERARCLQVPPSYSAIKVAGCAAHRLSRRGSPPALAPRAVAVRSLELVSRFGPDLVVELTVSKGYYVRALARDLGQTLGLPAHLAALRRLASGPFDLEEALQWPPVLTPRLLTTAAAARRSLPCVALTPEGVERARHGKPLSEHHLLVISTAATVEHSPAVTAWLDQNDVLVALGREVEPGHFRVVRGFRDTGQSAG